MTTWLVVLAAVLPVIFLRGFRRWVASMSGAVWILVGVAVLSLSGVFVGQNFPPEVYLDRYGQTLGRLIVATGLSSVFTSWYFLLLVSVLAVSLIACSAGRLRRLALARGGNAPKRAGALVLHASLVIVLAGGLVSAVFGYRYAADTYLGAGDSIDVPEGGFSLRVDAASTEFTPDGSMVREYFTDVTILEDGREVGKRRIEVNHPLVRNGVGVYQFEMLPSATSVDQVLLGVSMCTSTGQGPLRQYVMPYNEAFTIPGTDVSLKVLEFLSDFTYDIERRTAELVSVSHRNPAVLVQVSEADSVVAERWVFADVQTHRSDEGLPCRVFLLDYAPDFRNGLTRFEISHQPGTPLLYIGFAAMSLGLMLTFWTGSGRAGKPGPVDGDEKGGRPCR